MQVGWRASSGVAAERFRRHKGGRKRKRGRKKEREREREKEMRKFRDDDRC